MSETHCDSCGWPKPTHADRCPEKPRRLTPVPDSDAVSAAMQRGKTKAPLEFDAMPKGLKEHRTRVRQMMLERVKDPQTPIPPGLALRAADWIFFLTLIRANHRIKAGKPAFPDQETLLNDIARSAESVETVVIVMLEEAQETLDGLAKVAVAGPGSGLLVPGDVVAEREAARGRGKVEDPDAK